MSALHADAITATGTGTVTADAAPTDEQLRMAWPFFQGRYGCPDTLQAALQHRYYAPCIRALARTLHRVPMSSFNAGAHGAAAAAASRLGRETYVPPTPHVLTRAEHDDTALGRWATTTKVMPTGISTRPAHMSRPGPAARVGTHDAKRAAANDVDDDRETAAA